MHGEWKQFMMINNNFKNNMVILFTIVFFAIAELCAYGLPAVKDDSLRFEILLSKKMLNEIHLDVKFIESLEITSNQLIMLSSTDQFYVLGWGGIEPVGQKVADTISSYTYTSDGYLLIVRNKELCYIDSLGNFAKLYDLPSQAMGITAGVDVMYVYDRNKDQIKHALFVIAKGGKYVELFVVPSPIMSVVEMNQSILFSSGNALFTFNPKNKELKAVAVLQKDKEIISITVDTSRNRIYFSTENSIYALKDSSLVIITDVLGGILKYHIDGLLVFNPEKKFLIRMVGLEDKIASKMLEMKAAENDKKTTDALTNTTIINLVKAKLSDDLIINLINSSEVNFNLSVDSMIFLSNQNVSSAVIMAMKNAMKRKTSDGSNVSNH
jgi:hypothetical protein